MKATDYKLALLVLSGGGVDFAHLERVRHALYYRYPNLDLVDVCVPDAHLALARQALTAFSIRGFDETKFWEYPVAVIVLDKDGQGVGYDKIDFNLCRVYEADRWGMLRYCRQGLDEIEYPHVDAHVFNRLAAGLGNERMTYFPYGYTSQYVGLGPIDAFGHRIAGNLSDYAGRDPSHVLIAIFGGSAAWSTHTLHDEMFSTQLERRLNEYCERENSPLRISVVNLAQPSGVTLNDIISYMLFCFEAKPDIVIAHCGANDLAFGQTSDRYLVAEHKIVYQFQFERWAEILECGTDEKVTDLQWDNIPILTYPRQILEAFTSRIKQFEQLVAQSGKHFIAGLQPMIFSKSQYSDMEAEWMAQNEKIFWGPVLKNMDYLYAELLGKYPTLGCEHFVNLHQAYGKYSATESLFCDAVHTTPQGDQVIAEIYSEYIIANMLGHFLQS
ncbi:MAG: hypothetical protein HY850_06770 [Betaproteobacteria bacterium]|nr:hypothetical protein [Betaproteobacteria bacterium]